MSALRVEACAGGGGGGGQPMKANLETARYFEYLVLSLQLQEEKSDSKIREMAAWKFNLRHSLEQVLVEMDYRNYPVGSAQNYIMFTSLGSHFGAPMGSL
jgi:hypothetical protein